MGGTPALSAISSTIRRIALSSSRCIGAQTPTFVTESDQATIGLERLGALPRSVPNPPSPGRSGWSSVIPGCFASFASLLPGARRAVLRSRQASGSRGASPMRSSVCPARSPRASPRAWRPTSISVPRWGLTLTLIRAQSRSSCGPRGTDHRGPPASGEHGFERERVRGGTGDRARRHRARLAYIRSVTSGAAHRLLGEEE